MSHPTFEELIAAYALDSLDEHDRHEAEATLIEHIAACDPCRQLFLDLRETTSDLALAAPAIPVSAELTERILGAARAERPVAKPVARAPGRIARLGLVAAAIVILALGTISVSLYSSRMHDRHVQVIASGIIADHSASRVELCASGSARCAISVLPDGQGVLIASHMPAVARGRVFELWLLRDGVPTPATVFARADDQTPLLFKVAPGAYDHAAITVEPGPAGSQRPTGKMLYAGELKA